MRQLRAGVIGIGYLGRFHARKYAALPGVRLTAVVDTDGARAALLAAETGARPYTDVYAALDDIDVASVVVPTSQHYQVGRVLLEAGVHVLMEKPITAEAAQATALIELARSRGCVLQVGHLERFRPVVRALLERAQAPRFIEAQRLGPFTARGVDVNVVLDLMIHDLDLVLKLVQAPIEQIEASGAPVRSEQIDIATARLRFANGCVAKLTASRVSPLLERRLRLVQGHACFAADLGRHTLDCYYNATAPLPPKTRGIIAERKILPAGDPLREEIRAFLSAVRHGQPPPVDGADGLRALEAALAIAQQLQVRPPAYNLATAERAPERAPP